MAKKKTPTKKAAKSKQTKISTDEEIKDNIETKEEEKSNEGNIEDGEKEDETKGRIVGD